MPTTKAWPMPDNPAVAARFKAYAPAVRARLLAVRQLILQTAEETPGVGTLDETLKWGEPAYLTRQSRSGSTIRIDSKPRTPDQYALYFNCQTTLVDHFRTLFPHDFQFEGNRALVLAVAAEPPRDALRICITAALTYHRPRQPHR